MGKKEININGSATQMVDDINSNFGELYEGAGGTSSKDVKLLLTHKVTSTTTSYYNVNIKKGDRIVVDISPVSPGTESAFNRIWLSNSSGDEMVLDIDWNSVKVGGYGLIHEVMNDAYRIGMYGASVEVNIYKVVSVNTSDPNINRLMGKRWLLIGDSISTEYGPYAFRGYGDYVANQLYMEKVNIAASGKYVTYFIDKITDDWPSKYGIFDVITVMLGTNDKAYGATPGEVNDDNYNSYLINGEGSLSYSARLQILYEKLRRLWPQSMIMFITPIKRQGYNNYTEDAYVPFVEAMRDVCTYYQIPFINIYDTINPFSLLNRKKYFVRKNGIDGTHPNDIGHALFIAPVIKDKMLEGAQYYEEFFEHFPTDDEPSLEARLLPSDDSTLQVVASMDFTSAGSKTIIVHGVNLTGNVSLELTGSHFAIDKTIISDVAAMVWPEVVITYDGEASETATLTLSSEDVEDVVITLNGSV